MPRSVLLDTSFFLRFLNEENKLFNNSNEYYKYFLNNNFSLVISCISIAEYCVGGSIDELPLKNLQILPFNIDHSKRAGELARILFDERRKGKVDFRERLLIPNDSKLFAQADIDTNIEYFLTSDIESIKAIEILLKHTSLHFSHINLNIPVSNFFKIPEQYTLL